MATCATCSGELRDEWRFCVFCGTAVTPTAAAEAEAAAPARVNPIAIIALVLACVGGAPALIFGHLAMAQIRLTGERGMLIARIATGLGYLWLVVAVMLLYVWLSGAAA